MAEKDWNPDEPDPLELQKEQLALGKEFLARLKKQEEAEKAKQEERKAQVAAPRVAAFTYRPPPPEEVSMVYKKAWEETKRIMPDAPERVQLCAFQSLVQAFAPPPKGML